MGLIYGERLLMGEIYTIKCADCDYSIRVHEGIGMLYDPQAVFMGDEKHTPMLFSLISYNTTDEDSSRIRRELSGLLSKGFKPAVDIIADDYGHKLYACPQCNRLDNRFYFKLTMGEKIYEPGYICNKFRFRP